MLFSCMIFVVFLWPLCAFVCIPNYYVMVRCNDIQRAKVCQYAVLSLVGPLISFRIESHIGRDNEDLYRSSRITTYVIPFVIGMLLARGSIVGIPIPRSISLPASHFTRTVMHDPVTRHLVT